MHQHDRNYRNSNEAATMADGLGERRKVGDSTARDEVH